MSHDFPVVFLNHEDCREWFALDYQSAMGTDTPRLIIAFAESALRKYAAELPTMTPIEHCKKRLAEYGITTEFLLDVDRPWGFGGVLKPQLSEEKGILKYSIAIPRVKKDVGACRSCSGKGQRDRMECVYCFGTCREMVNDWDNLDRITASLAVLSVLLDKPNVELVMDCTSNREQLVSFQTNFEHGRAFIGADLSRTFGNYIRTLSGKQLPVVKAAMESSYLQMFPGHERYGSYSFSASVREGGQLLMGVPGDACGLFVDGFDRSIKELSGPMELNCHNVDGHHQQLALLCGLAALCGMAQKHLYPCAV